MRADEIIKIMKKYGLKPATRRDLPLLCVSVVGLSYHKALKDEIGFGYKAIGIIGKKNTFNTFFNEDEIAEKTEKLLRKNPENARILLNKADERYYNSFTELKKIKETINSDPFGALSKIVDVYLHYMAGLGMVNCIWRYLNINENKHILSEKEIAYASKKRDKIAKLYPYIEGLIQRCTHSIGKRYGFDGELLRYMTVAEIKPYLAKKSISDEKLKELAQRRKGYLYLIIDGKEQIFTQKEIIDRINNEFFKANASEINLIKGFSAYPGRVKGFVYNASNNKQTTIKKGSVFVIHMTRPDDTISIKRCSALVTDEGGVLCHAATMAREFKKPCIIGTRIATKVLKDGDLVEVNADDGIVKIVTTS